MLKEKELNLLSHFRNNSRAKLTSISKLTKIPVSTIFDKLKEYESNKIIKKHTALLDFRKLGYTVRTQILLVAENNMKDALQEFLIKHPRVNTVFRINNGYDLLVEAIFKDLQEMDEFTCKLEQFSIKDKKEFFIMEEMKREEFLTYKKNLELIL